MKLPLRIFCSAMCVALAMSACSCTSSSTNKRAVSSKIDWSTELENANLSESQFTECMAQLINESGKLKARIEGPLWLRVKGPWNEKEGSIYLDNAWKSSKNYPGKRSESLKPFIASWNDLSNAAPPDAKAALADIVPVIRSADINNNIEEEEKAYTEPFIDNLLVLYGIDTPKTITYLRPDMVRALKLEPAKLRTIALGNLLRKIPKQQIKHGDNFSMLIAGGDYEASFLLDDLFWQDRMKHFGGPVVVGVPSKDVVIFASEKDKKKVDMIRNFTKKGDAEFAHPISDRLLRYDGKWQMY